MKAAGKVPFSPEMVVSMCCSMDQAKASCLCYLNQMCFSRREEERANKETAVHITKMEQSNSNNCEEKPV